MKKLSLVNLFIFSLVLFFININLVGAVNCNTDSDCGIGEMCQLQFGSGACVPVPSCTSDSDCSGGKTCQFVAFDRQECQLSPQTQSNGDGCTFNGQGEEICSLENPIPATEVTDIIKTAISVALGVIGSFALLMLVWGGFQWLTSAGNPEKVSAGTQTMVWALIGVMVVLASYVLLSTFLEFLTGKQ